MSLNFEIEGVAYEAERIGVAVCVSDTIETIMQLTPCMSFPMMTVETAHGEIGVLELPDSIIPEYVFKEAPLGTMHKLGASDPTEMLKRMTEHALRINRQHQTIN